MKILAASLPEYFPSVYFYLKMIRADVFVVADNLQFSKHSLVNRTKIKTPGGFNLLTVPVIKSNKGLQKINNVKIVPESNWQRKQRVSLKSNYKYAPFFDHYIYKFESVFKTKWNSIIDLDLFIIDSIKNQLRLNKEINILSKLKIDKNKTAHIIEMAKHFNCDTYLIFESELAFIDKKMINNFGIGLKVLRPKLNPYIQQFDPFFPNLSIIDLLFNSGNESVAYLYSCIE